MRQKWKRKRYLGSEAELVEEGLHGLGEDLGDGRLLPPILHPDIGASLQQLSHRLLPGHTHR